MFILAFFEYLNHRWALSYGGGKLSGRKSSSMSCMATIIISRE